MRTCLVTGGAGFIGSHLADRLIEGGFRVVIIDNESTGFRRNVNPEAIYIRGDVTKTSDLEKAFAHDLDVVFHIAGQASTIRSFDDPGKDLRVNVGGTLNVLQLCLRHRVPRLLYASSMTAYGRPATIPTPETATCQPISYYGITKYAAERYVHATADRVDLDFGFHVTSFRMFNVYGERQSLDNPYQGVVSIFIANILDGEPITIHSDGEQSRDFVHIQDVVNAWVSAVDSEAAYEEVLNLGTGVRRSINELADVTLAAFDHSLESYPVRYTAVRPGDQRHMAADITKAAQILDWHPEVAFADGMKRTVRWAARQSGQ